MELGMEVMELGMEVVASLCVFVERQKKRCWWLGSWGLGFCATCDGSGRVCTQWGVVLRYSKAYVLIQSRYLLRSVRPVPRCI